MDSKKKKELELWAAKNFVKQLADNPDCRFRDILEDLSPSVILCQYCISTK